MPSQKKTAKKKTAAKKAPAPPKAQSPNPKSEIPKPQSDGPRLYATIVTRRSGVRARGFTFGAGVHVPNVPKEHADHLVAAGDAEILTISSR